MEEKCPYKRIGTTYYKTINKPNLFGDTVPFLSVWNAETIKHDHGKHYLSEIRKYDGFCFIPSHIEYKEEISGFLNRYQPLVYQPSEEGKCEKILMFIDHIFGEQREIGLDYLTILYRYPIQRLPILCLVSKERNTGKTTFLMFLKAIFGGNMTINTNDDFRSQFNSDWANKLIIGVDEVLLDKKEDSERIKNLSTAKTFKAEAKGFDRVEIEFIGKFILCSNNEDNFIIIDPLETRYWIRKINQFDSENENLLDELISEIPNFLHLLANRQIVTQKKSRMWFSPDEINTAALSKIKRRFVNRVELELFEILIEILENKELEELCFTNSNAQSYLERSKISTGRTELRKILEGKWNLQQEKNSLSYKLYHFEASGFLKEQNSIGRYYTFKLEDRDRIYDELMR